MSRNGGYKILDFKSIDVSGNGKTIAGIYDAIEGSTKALLCSGVKSSTTEFCDFYAQFTLDSTDFITTLENGYTLRITDDDLVTCKEEE